MPNLKFLCKWCGAQIVVQFLKPGEMASCRFCGARTEVPTTALPTDEPPSAGGVSAENPPIDCRYHPGVESQMVCGKCHAPICTTCTIVQSDDTGICPQCAGQQVPVVEEPLPDLEGVMCCRHTHVPAVQRCASCRRGVCVTCDFHLGAHFHLCPDCVEVKDQDLSDRRKNLRMWSYLLAGFGTALFAGAMATGSEITSQLAFVSIIVGTGLGFGALDRRLGNPPSLWGAAIWNSVVLGIFLVLIVIGLFIKE